MWNKYKIDTVGTAIRCCHEAKRTASMVAKTASVDGAELHAIRWSMEYDKSKYSSTRVLDKTNLKVAKFKCNLPGQDWIGSFLARHGQFVGLRKCQNIKRSRAEIESDELNKY
ncbi:hypothetical protein RRG08_028250 [Elysia crispata]|uniref:Uncharacterized protein n=1 Tax=Elysia crispata TaxID=231223 RepID=A0AAE0YEA5_9GAST|nr:hypothetical protein RRG08_028250 [Elysia crispata]